MRKQFRQFVFLLSVTLLGVYFILSAVNGQYGLFNRIKYNAKERFLIEELTDLKQKTIFLEGRVSRLSNDFLDLDLLDQQARKYLGVARVNEIILATN